MSVKSTIKHVYLFGAAVQFINFSAWNSHREIQQKLPFALRLPFGIAGCVAASLLWPISLPMMVAYDVENEKD